MLQLHIIAAAFVDGSVFCRCFASMHVEVGAAGSLARFDCGSIPGSVNSMIGVRGIRLLLLLLIGWTLDCIPADDID